jgi:hypothetical protein
VKIKILVVFIILYLVGYLIFFLLVLLGVIDNSLLLASCYGPNLSLYSSILVSLLFKNDFGIGMPSNRSNRKISYRERSRQYMTKSPTRNEHEV